MTNPREPQPDAPPNDTIEATDVLGRQVRLPRAVWRQQILPNLLAQAGDDPDRLTAAILQCLQLGFAVDVLPAAFRLKEVDQDAERSHCTLAAVQRSVGDANGAGRTLQALLQQRPDSAPARVQQALLAEARGDAAQVEPLLWEALQREPDNGDALHWYYRLMQARGAAALAQAVQRTAALPGAWRAPLWQARGLLEGGDADAALAIYRDVLARQGEQSDALLMAAGDLGQHGRHDAVAELVVPRYDVARHHPNVGINLLQHFLDTRQLVRGRELLHQLHLRFGPALQAPLQRFTAGFDQLAASALQPLPATSRVVLYRVDQPSWYAALRDPQWLLPQKPPGARLAVLPALAIDGDAKGHEEEVGRTARSVPLFLAEQLWIGSPHRASTALPMAEGGGWALTNQPWPEARLCEQLGDAERQQALLLSGVLRLDGARRRIDLWVYDAPKGQRIGHASAEGGAGELGRMGWQLLRELAPHLGFPQEPKPQAGNDAFWDHYVHGLGQHATLLVAQAGAMPKERLFAVRYILQWLANLVGEEPRWQPGWWLFLSGLGLDQQLGSPIHREFARSLVPLFQQSAPNLPFTWLCAAVLDAIGLPQVWQARREQVVAAAPEPVRNWLQKVGAV